MKKTALFLSATLLFFVSCKKDPPSAAFTADKAVANIGETITFTNNSENAKDYQWEFGDGQTSGETNPSHSYNTSGKFKVVLDASNGDESDTISATINVFALVDDFSDESYDWQYLYCDHSITNGILNLASTDLDAQSVVKSETFSPSISIPWTLKGDIGIIAYTSLQTDNGISCAVNDVGTAELEYMWLSIRLNGSNGANWIWLMWIPSVTNEWLPWDETCYGYSNSVNITGGMNSLELIANANKRITCKINGSSVLYNSDAFDQFESVIGSAVDIDIEQVVLRGGNETNVNFDNISLKSDGQPIAVKSIENPPAVSEEYIDDLFAKIDRGEDVTLKSLLIKKYAK